MKKRNFNPFQDQNLFNYSRFIFGVEKGTKELCRSGAPNKIEKITASPLNYKRRELKKFRLVLYKKCTKVVLKVLTNARGAWDDGGSGMEGILRRNGFDFKDQKMLAVLARNKIWVLRRVATEYLQSPALLAKLAKDKDNRVAGKALANKNIPITALKALATKFPETIAENPKTTSEILAKLAKYAYRPNAVRARLRGTVAKHKNTSASTLRLLAKEKDEHVRRAVGSNEKTPTDVLRLLFKDKRWIVRLGIASNEKTPSDILRLLAKDNDKYVRATVAENHKTPTDILQNLAKEKDKDVLGAVGGNKKTPSDVLRLLAKDKGWRVRRGVASNEKTPSDVLRLLAKDNDKSVSIVAKKTLQNNMLLNSVKDIGKNLSSIRNW